MSINKKHLISMIEEIAPPELMEPWDNTGVQISAGGTDVNRILVCLDVCEETVNEAVEKNCDFIVSHHPMFFEGIKSIDQDTAKGSYIVKLITNGISVYSSHTSFDTVEGGNNDYLAQVLGIEEVCIPEEEPIMRTGKLPEKMKLSKLCGLINSAVMNEKGLSFSGNPDDEVLKAGICTGAGASLMNTACELGCDVLITGDVKYHDFQKADELGLKVIDAGHYETEIFFAENMGAKLQAVLKGKAEVFPAKSQKNSLKRYYSVV